jgi:FAD/FMN-containing dehydrogenase
LADGSHVTTNSYQHPDLFWALRGGGGSTYGVVTSTTFKTYPIFSFTKATLTATFTSPNIAQDVVSEFIKIHPILSDAGWSASFALSNLSFSGAVMATDAGWADARTTFFSFVQYAEEATGGRVQLAVTPFDSFYEYYKALPEEATGSQVELASRLLPRSLAETDPAKAAKILLSVNGAILK